jgi:hypothetical protein
MATTTFAKKLLDRMGEAVSSGMAGIVHPPVFDGSV